MRQHRPDHVLERAEFLSRARSMARRGVALTHSKLTPAEVQEIRQAKENRLDLMAHISETLSNSALAEKYGCIHAPLKRCCLMRLGATSNERNPNR